MNGATNMKLPFVPMTLDQLDEVVLKGKTTARELNQPRSTEYAINNRNQKLHISSHWPDNPRAFIIFVHGYASHSNRPTHRYVEEYFAKYDLAYITMDIHSMGYSEGEPRCCVRNREDLVDDIISVALALTSDKLLGPNHNVKRSGKGLPFFLFGHSMGGGTCLAASNVFWNGRKGVAMTRYAWDMIDAIETRIVPYFRGCISMAPLTVFHHIPEWSKPWLQAVAMVLPELPLPTWFRDDATNMRRNWTSEKYIQYVLSDTDPDNYGLTYWEGVRFGSGMAMNDLCELVQESIPQAGFPMIFVHDPEDQTCNIEGSRQFVAKAPSLHKRLIELPNSLHDPMANMTDVICYYVSDWVVHQLNSAEVNPSVTQQISNADSH